MTTSSNSDPDAEVDLGDSVGRETVWPDLVLAMHLLETALERQTQRDGGMSHGHFKVLLLLSAATNRTLGLKSLADSLHFSPSRISHALTTLELRGLVVRRPTAGGRRASEATLTYDGRLLVGRMLRSQRLNVRDPLLDGLGELHAATLGKISARMIGILEERGTGKPNP